MLISESKFSQLIEPIIDLVKQAGKEILVTAEKDIKINEKNDKTPVTNADLAANDLIVKGLIELTKDIPIISEESEIPSFEIRKKWQQYWLIDPLDGTREFINNNGEYSINIALIDNNKAVLGVIYAPLQGVIYYACINQGAYKIEGLNKTKKIAVQKQVRSPMVVTCGNNQPGQEYEQLIKQLGDVEFYAMGSSLKSCLISDGSADLYARLGPTSEWDTAAAQCIVEEAGGRLTDLQLKDLRYNTKDSLLNPNFIVFGDSSYDWQQYFNL